MLKIERLNKIEEYIRQKQTVSIEELAEAFDVSKATARRDLKYLQSERKITLTRGGAVALVKGMKHEPVYYIKRHMNSEEKGRIAKAAASMVDHGETIIIDSSTTALSMPKFLAGKKGLTIATNDLLIAAAFVEEHSDANVIVLGGTVRKGFFTLLGYFAESTLAQMRADKAFIGVDSIDLVHGCRLSNIEEAPIKRKIIESARDVIVLCTHEKFYADGFINICDVKKASKIITGVELDEEVKGKYLDAGINIICV